MCQEGPFFTVTPWRTTSLQRLRKITRGREAGKLPVDHTPVKFVKKPAGAKPGMVIYTTYRTLMAQPDEALVKRLRVK